MSLLDLQTLQTPNEDGEIAADSNTSLLLCDESNLSLLLCL